MYIFKKYFYHIIFLLLFLSSMRMYIFHIITENKIIGHNWDWSFPATSYFFQKFDLLSYYLWGRINLGFSNYMRMLQLIPDILMKYLGFLFTPPLIIFILFLIIFIISFFFYKLFLDKFLSNKTVDNYLPSLLFAFSPFLFNDIIGGSWYMWLSYAFTPVYLYFLLSYFYTSKLLFLFYTSISLTFVISAPHHFVLLHALILSYFFYAIFIERKISLKLILDFLLKVLKIIVLLIVLGLYWILPLIYSWQSLNSTIISNENFNTFRDVKNTTQSIFNILSLSGYLNRNMYYFSLTNFLKVSLNFSVVGIWVIIIVSLFRSKSKKFLFIFTIFLLTIFFIKGGNPPLGDITMWFFYKFPIFKLFRSPQHLMYLAAFLTPLLIAFSLKKNRFLKTVYLKSLLLLFILILTAGWWYSGDIGHKSLLNQKRDHVDFYKLSPGLLDVYLKNEFLRLDQRFLFIPSVFSPFYLKNEYQNQAQGGIPEYVFLKNPTFASESNKYANFIDTAFCKNIDFNFSNYLSLFNFGYLVIRTDIVPQHTICAKFWSARSVQEKINKIASSKRITKKLDDVYTKFYEVNRIYFLPHFYTPQKVILTDERVKKLPEIVSDDNYNIRSAIYFKKQIQEKETNLKKLPEINNNPILEFKKINPTKYKIIVHQAKDDFPLIFSESFHNDWKAYLVQSQKSIKSESQKLNDYKILEENEEDQASGEELEEFIKKGWVSTLGDLKEKEIKYKKYSTDGKEKLDRIEKYKIDFISKNFKGTIQNDNLPNGHIWETWLARRVESRKSIKSKVQSLFELNKNVVELPEGNHLMVNGYANSWIINVEKVCSESGSCIKNPDGSYDFELVVEFWPQRLFYLGLGISGTALLFCLVYLGWDYKRRRKPEGRGDY